MKNLLLGVFACCLLAAKAQFKPASVIFSGPMLGHVDLRSATVWIETNIEGGFRLKYEDAKSYGTQFSLSTEVFNGRYIHKFIISGLEPGTLYKYQISNSQLKQPVSGTFTTQQLWQWRRPAPDFSFITGSCAYFNQAQYDRPGKPYGSDSVIFEAMGKEKADFMLWLGDNWYTREVDFFSESGLYYRASHDRATPVLQPLLKAMPQYAIWDDHDYGWDNADKSFPLKEISRQVFTSYWCNPSAGENGEGIYTRITWNDVDVFMLDDRWFRSNDEMKDSIDGKPNTEKRMFGKKQMEWLKNALLQSNENANTSFRIIATGSQVLNPLSPKDCLRHYPAEFDELMTFLSANNINGVIFLTGDRHHSEVIRTERPGAYSLYDITASSFTAGISKTRDAEVNNPYRVTKEIDEHNYARISFSGQKNDRKLTVRFMNIKGEKLEEWSVLLKDLSVNRH